MPKLEGNYYYNDGTGGVSSVIGYESKSNRVVRMNFTTGDAGATSISINLAAGVIQKTGGSGDTGADLTKIPFYITTNSDDSHKNANAADGYEVTGYITGSNGKAYSGSANIILRPNTTYYIWFFPLNKTYGWSYWNRNSSWYWAEYETSGTSKFSLSISAGTGSQVTVNRTYSALGYSTGNLSSGAPVYKNDKLKITFTPSTNYAIKTSTVNGTAFASGNTHTVSGNVAVVATAQVLASDVKATDANIGSVSTVTVTKYNSGYYHTLQYSFAGLTGYITNSGGTSASAVKFSNTSVPFTVPTSFYAKIPDAKTGVCTITCRTYSSSTSTTQLGNATTCTFTVTAANSAPGVVGTVVDTNATTIALTGDSTKLIRYCSTAKCTLNATPKNSASITTLKIGWSTVTGTASGASTIGTISHTKVSDTSFSFSATDSRGYSTLVTVEPTVVAYIQLTCNPIVARVTPTGSTVVLTLSGNIYRGSFGVYSNSLTLQYRYKQSDGSYCAWKTVSATGITIGTSSYKTSSPVSLGDDFDYKKDYVFQIKAEDGANGNVLSSVTKTLQVNRGIPVFDWGENDFNVNAELRLNNTNILNIMYPVGSVYMHSSSTMPTAVSDVGTWSSITTGISGVYAWKRTA